MGFRRCVCGLAFALSCCPWTLAGNTPSSTVQVHSAVNGTYITADHHDDTETNSAQVTAGATGSDVFSVFGGSTVTITNSGAAEANGNASPGVLRGYDSGTAYNSLVDSPAGPEGNNNNSSSVGAGGTVFCSYTDYKTNSSSSTITRSLTALLHVGLTYNTPDTSLSYTDVEDSADLTAYVFDPNAPGTWLAYLDIQNSATDPMPTIQTQSALYQIKPGQMVELVYALDITSAVELIPANEPGYPTGFNAIADASDTAEVFDDPLTPGDTSVWASRHDYSTPAPEPAALSLFGALPLFLRRHQSN